MKILNEKQKEIKEFLEECVKQSGITPKEINNHIGIKSNGGGLVSRWIGKSSNPCIPSLSYWTKLKEILPIDDRYDNYYKELNTKFIDRKCDNCGKIYTANINRLKHNREKFCSRICSYVYRNHLLEKLETYSCTICGKKIKRSPKTKKDTVLYYCSIECKGKAMSKGITNPSRLGTGKPKNKLRDYFKRKHFKYRMFDKSRGYKQSEVSMNDFIKIMENGKCYYCDSIQNLGWDRLDNKKGHQLDNVVVCCELCNMTRSDRFTVSEFKIIGEVIKKIREGRLNATETPKQTKSLFDF